MIGNRKNTFFSFQHTLYNGTGGGFGFGLGGMTSDLM